MSKKKILEEYKRNVGWHEAWCLIRTGRTNICKCRVKDELDFISKALDTIEKETKEKMAKALRMKETSPDDEYCEGWNDVVSILNENIDIYLKKHDN